MSLVFLPILSGCGKESKQETNSSPVDDSIPLGPEPGGMAVVALTGDPDVLNPLISRSTEAGFVLAEIQDKLIEMIEDLTNVPVIAESWTVAPDSLSITYTLNPWIWEDGVALTANDVAYSFELFKNPEVASNNRGFFKHVNNVEVIDGQTVRYHFSKVLPDPLSRTAHAILPWHKVKDLDPALVNEWKLNQAPLSSGPFRLASWNHSRELVLERNEGYPGSKAQLDRISFRIIKEPAARILSLESGEVDFVSGVSSDDALRLKKNDNLKILKTGGRRFYYVMWNCRNPLFKDATTRRALSLAIDRNRMIQTLLGGYGEPAVSPIAQAVWNYSQDLSSDEYSPERAVALLKTAGWKDNDGDGILERNGHPLEFEIITKQSDPIRANGVVILRENFAAVGARVNVRTMELATALGLLNKGEFDSYYGAMTPNLYGDPSSTVHSQSIDENNNGFYSNAVVDSLLAAALGESDQSLAKLTWVRLQEELKTDPPAAYLFIPQMLNVVSKRVQNVRPHVLSPINNIAEWWIAPSERKYRTGPTKN